ncbi:hypothetical protein FOL46_004573 [Perkinsus olseni]|uniref:Peptidase M3A/M3B catalytic domain-containing protein n=1 Tax=Perkinsus olseni TaxID=32597 RepID=A0A7J6MSK4_PEROL|nr:hypothetical protein FOL46_004573 [Perkinsus olseni]
MLTAVLRPLYSPTFFRPSLIRPLARFMSLDLYRITAFIALLLALLWTYLNRPARISHTSLNKLNFDLTVDDIKAQTTELIKESTDMHNRLAALKGSDVTVDNVLGVPNEFWVDFYPRYSSMEFLQNVSPDKEVREASSEADQKLSEHLVEMSMRKDVFDVLVALQEQHPQMDAESERLLDRSIKEGRRNGLHLDEASREEIEKMKKRMSELSIKFSKNLGEENTVLEFTKEELDGMSDDFLETLEKTESGKYKVTLKYPHYVPIAKKCKVRETRRKMDFAFNNRCADDNTEILAELVKLRKERAGILGFPSHADFATELKMAKNAPTVRDFLHGIEDKVKGRGASDMKLLKDLRKEDTGATMEEPLDSYDLSYYRNLVEEKNYSVDQLLIQEYFPFEHVLKTLLELYESILGLKFTRVTDQPVWHEDVVCLAVSDAADGRFIGYCYMDMFPREGKYSHAALFPLQPNVQYKGKRSYGVCSLVCNFTKSTPTKPSLLTHDEVVTFFHEFGHCMHHICAENVEYAEFAGTSVEQDFVECPSQMLENWCWEKDILKRLSCHYKTHEPLPDDLIEKLIKSRDANEGINTQRQLVFDNFDQTIHGVNPPSDITTTFNDISLQTMGVKQQEGSHFPATFGHMCGYDAKYYSYLWAEVFADDLFLTKFKKPHNLLNPETGMEYRKTILSRGGAVDASEILKEFLGREPNQEAFLEMKGLKA